MYSKHLLLKYLLVGCVPMFLRRLLVSDSRVCHSENKNKKLLEALFESPLNIVCRPYFFRHVRALIPLNVQLIYIWRQRLMFVVHTLYKPETLASLLTRVSFPILYWQLILSLSQRKKQWSYWVHWQQVKTKNRIILKTLNLLLSKRKMTYKYLNLFLKNK